MELIMRMNGFSNFFIILFLSANSLALVGCATNATVSGMTVKTFDKTITPHQKFKSGISIQAVKGGKETNPLWTSKISNENFNAALSNSLKVAGFNIADQKSSRYILVATFKDVSEPLFGFSFDVSTTINYVLVDQSTKRILFDSDIKSKYTAKFGDALYAVKRLRLANEGSARQNISQFIETMSKTDPDKVSVHIK
jgi:hypothetical protein